VQVEGIADRAGQRGLLVVEEQPDGVAQCLAPNRHDVVAADDPLVVEPVAGPDR
jgi:hypothetical protein